MLHEDWSNESVHLMTSISVEDINNVGVDSQLPIYCTLVMPPTSLSLSLLGYKIFCPLTFIALQIMLICGAIKFNGQNFV